MIKYTQRTLDNGLTVIIHRDESTPLVAVNVLYKVGSKDEMESKTGFAHLFEHLMFGGSKHALDFDSPIQLAGGENNAFTNCDITNYYETLPAQNIETALWLESDRMQHLILNKDSLQVQRKVVIEEFKETCLNKPYGDVWHLLSELSYKVHPYQWPTIGKDISHIETASIDDVADFYNTYYSPNNAILVIAGNIEVDKGFELAEKWFGQIPKGSDILRNKMLEPHQKENRLKRVEKGVPSKALFLTFPMPGKNDPDFYAYDLLSDVLSNGRSSRLFRALHKESSVFAKIDAYITGTFDPGLFIIDGRIAQGVSEEEAIDKVWIELNKMKTQLASENELVKIKNQAIANIEFGEINVLSKAMNLAHYNYLGDTELLNEQMENYLKVSAEEIMEAADQMFKKEMSNTLIYS